MIASIARFTARLGTLRTLLFVLVAGLVAIAPFAGGRATTIGLELITSIVAPALYVVVLFVLPLDMTMSAVFMSDKTGAERDRYRTIIWAEAALLAILLLAWAPFVMRLLRIG